jgi:hypothetical protein
VVPAPLQSEGQRLGEELVVVAQDQAHRVSPPRTGSDDPGGDETGCRRPVGTRLPVGCPRPHHHTSAQSARPRAMPARADSATG